MEGHLEITIEDLSSDEDVTFDINYRVEDSREWRKSGRAFTECRGVNIVQLSISRRKRDAHMSLTEDDFISAYGLDAHKRIEEAILSDCA